MKNYLSWWPRVYLVLAIVAGIVPGVRAAEIIPLAVERDRCECVLDTSHAEDHFLVVIGALAQDLKVRPITLRTEPCSAEVSLPRAAVTRDPAWQKQIQQWAQAQNQARLPPTWAAAYAPAVAPPQQKVFYLFTQERDFCNPAGYTAVTGRLHTLGKYCQVYVDQDFAGPNLPAAVADLVRTFDEEVCPRARQRLGQVQDVDRDGRFTILLTPWLARLQAGKVNVAGFVRGSDFHHEGEFPFSNRCDMMYLNAELQAGPFLRTVLAHEYTHAVIYSEHVFSHYLPGVKRDDEDAWLNEALCHLVEDEAGYSWRNLDYRISAFLSAPSQYPLVVPDYYGPGLWRTPGARGATYLFLRWCADRYGPELLPTMVRSNLQGLSNLETAAGQPFAELFRQWSVALALSGTNAATGEGFAPLRRLDLRQPLDRRLLCGPYVAELPLNRGTRDLSLTGTSVGYFLLHSAAAPRTRLTIAAEPGTQLQVTLIKLPRAMARLSLRWEAVDRPGTIRLRLTVHGGPVQLEKTAWECRLPRTDGEDNTSYRPGVPKNDLQDWFGKGLLKPGETRTSEPIQLPAGCGAGQPVVIKVVGRDVHGYRVSAWTVVDTMPAARR